MNGILLALLIFCLGIIVLIIINYFVQKYRCERDTKLGYINHISKGFQIKLIKLNDEYKYYIIKDEKPKIRF